jgi:hypothetical protein
MSRNCYSSQSDNHLFNVLFALALSAGCVGDIEETGTALEECEGSCETWCWTLGSWDGGAVLHAVELPSGNYGVYRRFLLHPHGFSSTSGLAFDGEKIVAAAYRSGGLDSGNHWLRLDMDSTEAAWGPRTRSTVTWDGSQYLADFRGKGLCAFADWDSLVDGNEGECIETGNTLRYAARNGEVFGAWFSTDVVEVYDWPTGDLVREVSLDGWDNMVHGVSVVGDIIHIISSGEQLNERTVLRFSALNGEFLDSATLTFEALDPAPSGLWCHAGRLR